MAMDHIGAGPLAPKDINLRSHKEHSRHILLQISAALRRFHRLDDLLDYTARLTRVLMRVDGASVILPDGQAKEFFFQTTSYCNDAKKGHRLRSRRFPMGQGSAGEVYRSGKPMIVEDYVNSPLALKSIDGRTGYKIRNLLDAPLRIQGRVIGVLRVVNKHKGPFDQRDVELLGAIADVVVLPVENARLNLAIRAALEQVRQLCLTKERVIQHLSHELKTPLAVLSASISLLGRGAPCPEDPRMLRIHDRIQRNLQRLLDVEYHLEDLLRD